MDKTTSDTSRASKIFDDLAGTIQRVQLTESRKQELEIALTRLKENVANFTPRWPPPIYIMEGATGVTADLGRPSTDPDENMAIKVIAFVTAAMQEPVIIAVPDEANHARTMDFLGSLGIEARSVEPGMAVDQGAKMYVARMDSQEQMRLVMHPTFTGKEKREVIVLGPPLGYVDELLGDGIQLTIMGSAQLLNGKVDARSLSTNTKDLRSEEFLLEVLSAAAVTCIPSGSMGPKMAISLTELGLATDLISNFDKLHWARNSKEQFLGIAGYDLLKKRLNNSGARQLFIESADERDQKQSPLLHKAQELIVGAGTHSKQNQVSIFDLAPKRDGLAFLPFLQAVTNTGVQPDYLPSACSKLGPGYEFLLSEDGWVEATRCLRDLIVAHLDDSSCKPIPGVDDALQMIGNMSRPHQAHAFAALALAFQNIYEEKTSDGWNVGVPGSQWRAQDFEAAYLQQPGKQVPYDAAVVLQQITGLWHTDQDKAVMADKILLALWSDLSGQLHNHG